MPSEDITFCMNDKCEEINCIRNPKRIRMLIPHSFAWLEGTEDCYKVDQAYHEND